MNKKIIGYVIKWNNGMDFFSTDKKETQKIIDELNTNQKPKKYFLVKLIEEKK